MADGEDKDLISIPKLANGNYFAWKLRVKAHMIDKNCWVAIEPGFDENELNVDQARLNRKALSVLYKSVGDDFLLDVEDCVRAKQAWEILEEIHVSSTKFNALQSLKEMTNITKTPDTSMQEYAASIQRLNKKIARGDIIFDDEMMANFLLVGLPMDEYETFVQNLLREPGLTTRKVKGRLLDEERRRNQLEAAQETASSSALISKKGKTVYKPNKKNSGQSGSKSGSNGDKKCYKCQKPGHISKFCPEVKCFNCNEFGHWASDCTKLASSNGKSGDNGNGNSDKRGKTIACISVFAMVSMNSSEVWYLDSAASEHMTSKRELFSSYTECRGNIKIGKGQLTVRGTGVVKLTLSDNCGGNVLEMKNVLYAPDLAFNLISVGRLAKNDVFVHFNKEGAKGMYKNECVFTSVESNGLYLLEPNNSVACVSNVEVSGEERIDDIEAVALRAVSSDLWHVRLGHLHESAMKKIPYLSDLKCENKSCDVCILGKMTKCSFPQKSERQSSKPLELVHSDLLASSVKSNGGHRYMMSFVDDYSRFTVVKFLKTKGEAFSKFLEYQAEVEKMHDSKLKCFQTDGGGEYCSNKFEFYLKENGIGHRKTVAYTPEQNGIAERFNRTAEDMIRCLLTQSGLSDSFWAEAANTACVTRNLCPSRAIGNQIPYEMWKGESAEKEYPRLRAFGCRAWLFQEVGKFQPRAVRCVFIGYENNVKGYKLLNLETKKVMIGYHVKFDESMFPMVEQDNVKHVRNYVMTGGSSSDESEVEIENNVEMNDQNVNEAQGDENVLRRSERLRKLKVCSCCNLSVCALSIHSADFVEEPLSVDDALKGEYADEWREAMEQELQSIQSKGTYVLVNTPADKKVLGCKWVLKLKRNPDGSVNRFKARLVAQGFGQVPGRDFSDTFAPVIKRKTIRLLMALTVRNGWAQEHIDVLTAYLHSDLTEEIYVSQPKYFEVSHDKVWKLLKSLYGLKQSAKEWHCTLNKILIKLKFVRLIKDRCLYVNKEKNLVVGTYVDDLALWGPEDSIEWFKSKLEVKLDIRKLGNMTKFLSMNVEYAGEQMSIHQSDYIRLMLKEFNLEGAIGRSAPLEINRDDGTNAGNEPFDSGKYRKAVGMLLYLSTTTRPDIAFAVCRASKCNVNPTKRDWQDVKHIMLYLKQTVDLKLIFKRIDEPVEVFCDADYANGRDRKSVSGFVSIMSGAPVSWSVRLPKSKDPVASSTTEAEFISMYYGCQEALWLKYILTELGQVSCLSVPLIIKADNQSAIKLTENFGESELSKHFDVKYNFSRDYVEKGIVKFEYVTSNDNLADIFTKPLNGIKTKAVVKAMSIV